MEERKNIRATKETFEKFEELRYGLRFKKSLALTQDQLVGLLVSTYQEKLKAEALK